MTHKISRREFLKISGAGLVSAAVLTGCGPVSRHVVRRPYSEMPEFNQTGKSTFYATTCRECAAGCGLIVRTVEGRAVKIDGNPNHPVNRGKICARGVTGVQGLYNPDRLTGPIRRTRGSAESESLEWNAAVEVVSDALAGGGVEFLLGSANTSLFDLASEIAAAAGSQPPVKYSTMAMLASQATLEEAARRVYGQAKVPYFDLANADVILSFGAGILEEWISPLLYARQYQQFRQKPQGRGHLVVFEARQSNTSGIADEWISIAPGSEGQVALALGRLVADAGGPSGGDLFSGVDPFLIAESAGVALDKLQTLAARLATARQIAAVPGGAALGHTAGIEIAQAVLSLNTLSPVPSVFFPTAAQAEAEEAEGPSGGGRQITDLIERMNGGQVQALFIHGVNPVFELPRALGFDDALANVPLVISFSSFPDETALQSDYVFPDHTSLESFGYVAGSPGTDRTIVSAMQPVVVPLYNTRATSDVLIAAAQAAGAGLGYDDEVAFVQSRLRGLVEGVSAAGTFQAADVPTFWANFLQFGGWWTTEPDLQPAEAAGSGAPELQPAKALSEGRLHMIVYPTKFGDGSVANRPWLQELPDGMTTVMWNSWVLIHPQTAEELGIHNNDVVRISSQYGWVESVAYVYPAIRPDTVAMPFGQGHTAFGRWATGRGSNPAFVMTSARNAAGDLAFADLQVTVEPTGRRRPLAALESRTGVYGEH